MGHLSRFIPCVVHGHVFVDSPQPKIRREQPGDKGIAEHAQSIFLGLCMFETTKSLRKNLVDNRVTMNM